MSKKLAKSLVLILVLSFIFSANPKNLSLEGDYCRILALEGGGDNGAYQAGALKGLIENLQVEDAQYDIITGISLGAFNGAILSTFPLGQEKQAVTIIENFWSTLQGKEIYKNWPLGVVEGFLTKESLYNNSVEFKKLESYFKDKKLYRSLFIGATNAVTAEYEYFDNEILEKYGIAGAIMATSALPPLFSSYSYIGNHYYDGSIKHSVDFITGVNKCKEKGFTADKIVIDLILCNSAHISKFDKKNFHVLGSVMRLIEILSFDGEEYDREAFDRYFPDIKIRHFVIPSQEFPASKHPYEFDSNDIKFMLELGYKDAVALFPKEKAQ